MTGAPQAHCSASAALVSTGTAAGPRQTPRSGPQRTPGTTALSCDKHRKRNFAPTRKKWMRSPGPFHKPTERKKCRILDAQRPWATTQPVQGDCREKCNGIPGASILRFVLSLGVKSASSAGLCTGRRWAATAVPAKPHWGLHPLTLRYLPSPRSMALKRSTHTAALLLPLPASWAVSCAGSPVYNPFSLVPLSVLLHLPSYSAELPHSLPPSQTTVPFWLWLWLWFWVNLSLQPLLLAWEHSLYSTGLPLPLLPLGIGSRTFSPS